MKSLMLEPTKENIQDAIENDYYHRVSYAIKLVKLINSIEGHFVIGIDGNWGSGKTFFIKEVQMLIDKNGADLTEEQKRKYYWRESISDSVLKYKTLYFDAWAHDNDESPLLSILNELLNLEEVSSCLMRYSKKDIAIKAIEAIATIVSPAIGTRVKSLGELVKMLKGEDVNKEYKEQMKLEEQMNILFDEILKATQKEKIVFFIDELDRCKPTYAVRLLEQMKHYFHNEQVMLVISTNIEQLQHTIQRIYGANFSAVSYLNRFIDMTFPMPPIAVEDLFKTLRYHTDNIKYDVAQMVSEYYKFSLREIIGYMRLINIYNHIPNNTNIIRDDIIIPVLLGMRIRSINAYNNFLAGKSAEEFIHIMQTAGNLDSYWQETLLKEDETFVKENISDRKTYVNFANRFREFYQYLFGEYTNPLLRNAQLNPKKHHIGNIDINVKLGEQILGKLDLLKYDIQE